MGEPTSVVTPRPDILAEVNRVCTIDDTFIADFVLPPYSLFVSAGKIPVNTATTNRTAQTGRSPGGAITPHNQTVTLTSFTLAERLDREEMDRNQSVMLGGPAGEELQLGLTGILAIKNSVESAVATLVTAGSATDLTAANAIYEGIRNGVTALKSYGRVGLAGSAQAWQNVRNDSIVRDVQKATGMPVVPIEQVRGIGNIMLAATFGADQVYEATGAAATQWPDNLIVPFVIANKAVSPSAVPQVGRRLLFTWQSEGMNESLVCEQLFDPSVRCDVLDFIAYDEALIFNASFLGAPLKVAAS